MKIQKTKSKINTWMISVLFLIFSITPACSKPDNNDETMMMLLILLFLSQDPAPNQTYVSRAATALNTWNVNLQTGVSSNQRTTDTNFVMNPPNWITVANTACNARGIPASWQGETCNLSGGTIGLCITRYYTSGDVGRLIDTTLVMLDTFQADSSITEATKQSVFTHEVGHCLGLRHTFSTDDDNADCNDGSDTGVPNSSNCETGIAAINLTTCGGSYTDCIMYPSTAGADTPHTDELSAINAAYNPIALPAVRRYSQTNGTVVQHWTHPVFTVSSVIGSAMIDEADFEAQTAPLQNLEGEVEIRVHSYKQDGSSEVKTYDNTGSLIKP